MIGDMFMSEIGHILPANQVSKIEFSQRVLVEINFPATG